MATRTQTEIFAILGEWKRVREEGTTQKQFAQDRGLSVRTLREWERRFGTTELEPLEIFARAQVLIDELKRLMDSLQPVSVPNPPPDMGPKPVARGHQRPDSFNFF